MIVRPIVAQPPASKRHDSRVSIRRRFARYRHALLASTVVIGICLAQFTTVGPAHADPLNCTQYNSCDAQVLVCGSSYACANGYLHVDGENGYGYSQVHCNFSGNSVNMGGTYDNFGCENDEYQFRNRGYSCSGCQDVRIYWGEYYTGAWQCITPGWQWTQNFFVSGSGNVEPIRFSHGSSGLAGYGQQIWYNTASERWTGTCG